MPFRLLAPLAGLLVLPAFRRREADIGDLVAVLGEADFGIRADISDQDDFIYGTGHCSSLAL
jgi:hypothetical protein